MITLRSLIPAIALTALAASIGSAQAQTIDTSWVDWTARDGTVMTGTLMLASGAVKVRITTPAISFAQFNEGQFSYWSTAKDPDPYAVTGAPTNSDIIAFTGGTSDQRYKVSFSRPVTNPVMAILSLGRPGQPTRYVFAQTPTLLSSGTGYYGGCADCLTVKKRTVSGVEGHGVVQFVGTFSSISWKQPDYEYWHGIQVGAPKAQ